MTKALTPEDVAGARNHTGLSVDEVLKRLAPEKTVELECGDLRLIVQRAEVEKAVRLVGGIPYSERESLLRKVSAAISEAAPIVSAGNADKETCDGLMSDLCIREALWRLRS